MNEPQPDHDPAIQEFHQWVRHARSLGSGDARVECDRPFLPYRELEKYFNSRYRVQELLRALFHDRAESPVGPDEIRENYSKVFFILVLIGRGCYIEHFVRHDDLCDQRLPFNASPENFPIAPTGPDLFDSFHQKQWEFCVPIFQDNMNKIFGDREVLPIIHKERLGIGGSATTFKVILHPAYDQLTPKRNTEKGISDQHANTYVLKTYETKEAEKYYTNEVSAFRELRRDGKTPDIIGYHGSFTQKGTYNVILEYADKGTLEDYFRTTTPPSRGEDIIKFWRGIFRILNGLNAIHNVPSSAAHGPHFLQGWHQDVKPANILVKSSQSGSAFECLFKLADLGLSHFTRTMSPTTGKDTHGTQTYGAPECYLVNDLVDRESMQVTPSVDIYSLGCVFSEAAIWVVRGWDGLQEYRRRRRMETQNIANFRGSDCFHDGDTTLSVVNEMHNNLIHDCGRSDHVTEAALTHMIREMLEVQDGRRTARVLYIKSDRILSAAVKELERCADSRYPGGMNAAQSSQHKMDDRARTPPQVPNGYDRYHSRISQGYSTISNKITSDPESTPYPKVEDGHPVYNFNPPTTPLRKSSKRSPPFGRHEDFVIMGSQSYDQAAIDDDDQWSASPSSPVSSERGYACPNPSRIQGQGMFNSRKGQNNGRAGTSPAGSPVTDRGMLDRDVAFTKRNSRQDQLPASSGAFSGEDTSSPTGGPHSGQRKIRTSQSTAAQPEAARTPLFERSESSSATPSPGLKSPPPLPTLTVPVAQKWKDDTKRRIKTSLPHDYLIENLNRRDHIFLIDDSFSMERHWQEVEALFGLLAYMVKDSDPDGIELRFTISSKRHRSKKGRTKDLTKILHDKKYEGDSNIRSSLQNIVQKYKEGLKKPVNPATSWWRLRGRPAEPVRDQNVYVFTDGTWQPNSDPTEIIADLVGDLKEHKVLKEQFGIQFISFGNDPSSLATLERLDKGLNLPLDIIDTEPSNGNVWKMLLGAVNEWFDDTVNDGGPPPKPDRIATNGAGSHGQRLYP